MAASHLANKTTDKKQGGEKKTRYPKKGEHVYTIIYTTYYINYKKRR